MAKSKTTTKKTEQANEPVAVPQQEKAAVPDRSLSGKRRPAAVRRVPVQYTPRIPSARCPGC